MNANWRFIDSPFRGVPADGIHSLAKTGDAFRGRSTQRATKPKGPETVSTAKYSEGPVVRGFGSTGEPAGSRARSVRRTKASSTLRTTIVFRICAVAPAYFGRRSGMWLTRHRTAGARAT